MVLAAAPPASAAVFVSGHPGFTLGDFDTYGILINTGTANADINTAPVNANIGVGKLATGKKLNLHNEVVNGKVDLSDTAAHDLTGGAITGTQPVWLGGPAPASVNSNVALVDSAIADAVTLATTFSGEAASAKSVTINTGSMTINADDGFDDSYGVRVFKSSTFAIGNGNALTIHGLADEFVVIDITGNSTLKLDGALNLTGGITQDHVLINFTGTTGELKGAANGATLHGTILAPGLKVNVNSLKIDGHLFGGRAGQDFQFVSNAYIRQPPGQSFVPEPAAWALMTLGAGLAGAGLRRNRAQRLAA
jgi:hypothetical protein